MSRLIKFFKMTLLFLIAVTVVLVVLIFETKPLVVANASKQVDDADSVNILLRQIRQITQRRFVPQTIYMSNPQMNSLVGFMQRAVPEFSGEVLTDKEKLTTKFTYKVPVDWFSLYLNFSAELITAPGVQVRNIQLGDLPIYGQWGVSAMTFLVNWWTNSDLGDMALNQVSEVKTSENAVEIRLIPIHDFLVSLNEIKNGLSGSDNEELKQKVTFYLAYLDSLSFSSLPTGQPLADYLKPLFQKAQSQTVNSSAVVENEAALLALAIYAGHHRIANFIGNVQPFEGKVVMPYYRPLISGRSDLTQHFVISAAIKILSQQGISAAIGEFKELMDRAEGGSGFSFADLAADLAGIKLAVMAIDPVHAETLQASLANISSEEQFFPAITHLPEGLSKNEFSRQYGDVEGEKYKQVVALINQRIDDLALYQGL
ncbi:hypothetical protein [Aliiglaciecola lipolytica]|uniref:Uncharacterized protein n=1 Tax=Aliiglaciecola lipolytica E3 TaxID=1127673 RepID=K6YJY3_9ALTE|nr:hypothetical protein [Aliiglaciecola lipolytica]GAC16918.1 hypothetical protein GLIP_4307 [Aliiglaciecola lipolytica E3]